MLIIVAAGGCGSGGDGSTSAASSARAERCACSAGSWTDIAGEPANWRAMSSGRTWTDTAGCALRIDVVADYDGAAHCGFVGARYLALGMPVGSRYLRPRIYVRDPDDVYGDEATRDALDLDARLPGGARDSGLRLGETRLLVADGEPEAIYLQTGDRVER